MKRRSWLGLALLVAASVALAAAVAAADDPSNRLLLGEEAEGAPWRYAAAMSQRRSYVAAAELDGKIYAAGGMVGETGRRLATFQRFDPAANRWTTLERLPEPVRAAAGVALDGAVYVIGGDDADGEGTRVWAYDVAAGRWDARAPLPAPRFNHAAVALGGKIYVLGGFEGGREHDDVFVYDPEADAWTRSTSLPRPNHAFGAVAFGGEVWTIGGRRGDEILREVWILDRATGRWRAGPELPEPMELLGAAAAGDEIHAVWESVYQIYEAGSGTWRRGPRSLVTRHGLEAFAIGAFLYTVGGCTTELVDSQVVERRRLDRH